MKFYDERIQNHLKKGKVISYNNIENEHKWKNDPILYFKLDNNYVIDCQNKYGWPDSNGWDPTFIAPLTEKMKNNDRWDIVLPRDDLKYLKDDEWWF